MDRVIIIEQDAPDLDLYGNPIRTWSPVATVRAQLMSIATQEFLRGNGANEETSITFRIYWLDGVTTANRITYEGAAFDIKEIRELGLRRGLDIRCERIA